MSSQERLSTIELSRMITSPEFGCLHPEAVQRLTEALVLQDQYLDRSLLLLEEMESDHSVLTARHVELVTELKLAKEVQDSLLPQPPYVNNNLCSVDAKNLQAKIVGGDFFDIIDGKSNSGDRFNRLMLTIGDAVGHGMPAALNAMRVMTLVRAFANRGIVGDMTRFVSEINFDLCGSESFTTMMAISYEMDSGNLSWVSAGQGRPLIFDEESTLIDIGDTYIGPPVGILLNPEYKQSGHNLQNGETAIFYTDGCREAFNSEGIMLDEKGFVQIVQERLKGSQDLLCDNVLQDVLDFTGGDYPDDDFTMLVIRRK